jgi:hypothetical protein
MTFVETVLDIRNSFNDRVYLGLFFLTFTPSITFSLFTAEVFPYAFIVSVLLMFRYSGSHDRNLNVMLDKNACILAILLFCSSLYGVMNHGLNNSDIIRSVIAYLNPFLIFFSILNCQYRKVELYHRAIKYVFIVLLVIGFLQVTGLGRFIYLGSLIEVLIPRGEGDLLGLGRGATLLSSEPSRASLEFLFIALTYRYICLKLSTKFDLLFDIFVLAFLLLVMRSATGLLYFFIYFFCKRFFLSMVFACLVSFFITIILMNVEGIEVRALQVLTMVLNTPLNGIYELFLNVSGFRGISVHSSYLFGVNNFFGGGVGFWNLSSLSALNESGFDYRNINYFAQRYNSFVPVRSTSYGASVMLDMGLIGFVVFISILLPRLRLFSYSSDSKPLVYLFLFYIFLLGSIGNPVPWICVALLIRDSRIKQTGQGNLA